MEMNVRVSFQPAVLLRLMCIQIVQYHVNLLAGMFFHHNQVRRIKKLPPPTPRIVPSLHLSSQNIESRK